MKLISGEDLADSVENIISSEKQVHRYSVDLTVKEVYRLTGGGQLDFGGSEHVEPKREKLAPSRKKGEEHGWWDLGGGRYLITFNETVAPIDGLGLLSPHPRLLKSGSTHTTLVVHEWKGDYVLPLDVGGTGLKLKQNSRVSKLLVLG